MGAKHSQHDSAEAFVSHLRQLHAVKCCLSGWATIVDDVAEGRVELDLDDRTHTYLSIAKGLPRIRAGEVGLMVKDQVGALNKLAEALRGPAKQIADIHARFQREADAIRASGAPESKEEEIGGGERVYTGREKNIARILGLSCGPAECDPGTLAELPTVLRQIRAARNLIVSNLKDPYRSIFEIHYRADPTMTDKRLKDASDRCTDELEEIGKGAKDVLHRYEIDRDKMVGAVRRALDAAIKLRREVALDFGEVIMRAMPTTSE